MKNLIIAIIVIAIAALIYTQVSNNNDSLTAAIDSKSGVIAEATKEPKNAPAEELIDTSSLISSAPANAAVFILEPGNGSTVTSPVTVKFGISNMSVAPAGDNTQNSGHHHILIDLDELPDMTQPLPANENVVHFGLGQTETMLELEPGEHTLQLLLGNYLHIPHDTPVVSKQITITVE